MTQWFNMGVGDKQVIGELFKRLIKTYEQFAKEKCESDPTGEGLTFIDGFMAAHNFHKAITMDLAGRIAETAPADDKDTVTSLVYQMASSTFEAGLGLSDSAPPKDVFQSDNPPKQWPPLNLN